RARGAEGGRAEPEGGRRSAELVAEVDGHEIRLAQRHDDAGGRAQRLAEWPVGEELLREAVEQRERLITLLQRGARALARAGDALEERYQALVLLNRLTQELFSDRPFRESLSAAARVIMALCEADFVSIHFCDEFGRPAPAFRLGPAVFGAARAAGLESALVARAAETRALASGVAEVSLTAAPMTGVSGGLEGVLVAGRLPGRDAGRADARALAESARHLRDARLIQKNLQQRRAMAAVTEQSADAVLLTDAEGRVVSWNPSAESLFGWSREEALGLPTAELCPPEAREEAADAEARARRDGRPYRYDSVRRRKDGALVPVEVTYSVLRDENGSSYGMVRSYRDITRRKEVERAKSEFVSMVSHELRTPLTAIQGFSETLRDLDGELEPARRREYARIIFDESRRLGRLVTDFLDLSRLEAGAVELRPEPVALEPLAGRLAALFQGHPSRARLTARFAGDAGAVRADADQLYRVLLNLCGNALKYTPADGEVSVSSRRDGGFVEVEVRDQGPGIPVEHQARIFERFSRLADPVSRKVPGTGLGLAICKGIVEAHGGRIWVESRPGHGAAFRFTMPAA
ncbi:MAG: ATP-binding protein, partial [Elusimicrobiota bacterium]|nr:ATP-binding protein [Elusimicrobiota bacterium]